MTEPVLMDTGPLVALLNPRDGAHQRCRQTAEQLRGRCVTCWPVLTEAAWLLRHETRFMPRLAELIRRGGIEVLELGPDSLVWIAGFMERYHELPAQLADASLMYLAQRERIQTAFTLDRREFLVFRDPHGREMSLLPQ